MQLCAKNIDTKGDFPITEISFSFLSQLQISAYRKIFWLNRFPEKHVGGESAISQVQKVMPNTEGAAGKDAKEPHSLRIKFEKQYWENRICEALAYIEMLCVTATGCDVVSPFVTIEPRSGLPLFFAEAERKIASYTRVDDNGNEYWK